MIEEWRAVVGWEGFYEVSNWGRVRSLDRVVDSPVGVQHYRGKILKPRKAANGYLTVGLTARPRINTRLIHQIVLEAFVGPRPEGLIACHYNDVFTHNYVENLRWDTPSSNTYDKVRNGNHPMAKKTHCVHGHLYTEENTYRSRNGYRQCRTCIRKRKIRNEY